MKLSLTADLQQISSLYTKIIERKVYHADADYHLDALLAISKNKGMITRKKLAKQLRITTAQANAIIYTLHGGGFIYLLPNDSRVAETYMALTPKGDENVVQIQSEIALLNEKITTGIADDKLESFMEILDMLKANLKRESMLISSLR